MINSDDCKLNTKAGDNKSFEGSMVYGCENLRKVSFISYINY